MICEESITQNAEENVLILTLGVGTNIRKSESESGVAESDAIEQKNAWMKECFETGNLFCYRETFYSVQNADGSENVQKSEFVAEPLVRLVNPDEIFIIGTVKSSWSSFYNKFAAEEKKCFEHYRMLFDIESEHGMRTETEKLKSLSDIIASIYQKDEVLASVAGRSVMVHILLTRYGMNDRELRDNYSIISQMEEVFRENITYHISFDITHSFRSMPFYDLVVLNYLKYTTRFQIEISHVYYGLLEVSRENNGIAPVIDLKDLVRMLELTNGIGEFRDTGNTVALLAELSGDESELRSALENFDWATQLNDYGGIIESLRRLMRLTEKAQYVHKRSRYQDLYQTLNRVLSENFISGTSLEELCNIEAHPENLGELQLCICKWYQSQNRYGQAVLTALEALRSFLTPLYLMNQKAGMDLKACRNEGNRGEAEELFHKNVKARRKKSEEGGNTGNLYVPSHPELNRLLSELDALFQPVKKIRNRFAHNLEGNLRKIEFSATATEKVQEGEADEHAVLETGAEYVFSEDKAIIDTFISYLEKLKEAFRNSREKLAAAYAETPDQPKEEVVEKKVEGENVRLIISPYGGSDAELSSRYERYLGTDEISYDVYYLPESFLQTLRKCIEKDKAALGGYYIWQYVQKWFESPGMEILLDGFGYFQSLYFPAYLLSYEKKRVRLLSVTNMGKEESTGIMVNQILAKDSVPTLPYREPDYGTVAKRIKRLMDQINLNEPPVKIRTMEKETSVLE
ncbi:MAG: TIGR02221 family CRISPR-associated protein [Clostridiaceae bacterium]|nr:TIGR02221 family CRISPR-associated protein [Clostridiaceae bacterium]